MRVTVSPSPESPGTSTGRGTGDSGGGDKNARRVQLQTGTANLSSIRVTSSDELGISVEQLRGALLSLYADVQSKGAIPADLLSALKDAVIRSSIVYGKYPLGGFARVETLPVRRSLIRGGASTGSIVRICEVVTSGTKGRHSGR